jgi:hypothetical protein
MAMLLATNTCATVDGACVAFAVGLDSRNVTDIVRRSASRFNPSRCAQYPAVPVASLVGMPRPARCGINTGSSAVAPVRPCSTVGQVTSRVDLHCSGFACRASAVPCRHGKGGCAQSSHYDRVATPGNVCGTVVFSGWVFQAVP